MFGSFRALSSAALPLLARPVSLLRGPASVPTVHSTKRISELVAFMQDTHKGLLADPWYGAQFLRPSACRTSAAGVIERGSLVKVRCVEIGAMCHTYLGLLNVRSGEARALLERTLGSAQRLAESQAGNISELDIRMLEERIKDALPPSPGRDLFAMCGFGDGQATINRADLDTPVMTDMLYEMMDAAPLCGVTFIVIANCSGPQDAAALRDALNARGLQDVKVVPCLETRKDMKKLFGGDYQGAHSGRLMMECDNYGKHEGDVQRDIDVVRFELACREQGFVGCLVTGGVTVPASEPAIRLAHDEIANVQLALQPLITSHRVDRLMYSDFSLAWRNSAMGEQEVPFSGVDACMHFGQAFGFVSPLEVTAMADTIQALRQGGTEGEKELVHTILLNQASQMARVPAREGLVEVWRARGIAPGDMEAMWQSVANVTSLLDQTGFGPPA